MDTEVDIEVDIETDTAVTADAVPGIDRDAVAFYDWAVRQHRFDPGDLSRAGAEAGLSTASCRAAIAALRHRGLLRPAPGAVMTVTGPHRAGAPAGRERAEPDWSALELASRQERIERTRTAVQAAAPALPAPAREEPVTVLPDPVAGRAALRDRLLRATREVALCSPGGDPTASALTELVLGELPCAAPGLRTRIVHQHPARFHQFTQQQARAAFLAGAEVRTAGESCGPLLVIDREVAVLPEQGSRTGLVLVTEPSLVAHLADSFETLWHRGAEFRSGPAAARSVSDELRATMLRLLADGLKDEVIARRLGISLRSCRRHIAGLYGTLGAESRFQAGVLAERHGLTGPRPAAPPSGRRPDDPARHEAR